MFRPLALLDTSGQYVRLSETFIYSISYSDPYIQHICIDTRICDI